MMKNKKGFLYGAVRFFGMGIIAVMIIPAALALWGIRIVWNAMDVLLSGGDANDGSRQQAEETI